MMIINTKLLLKKSWMKMNMKSNLILIANLANNNNQMNKFQRVMNKLNNSSIMNKISKL